MTTRSVTIGYIYNCMYTVWQCSLKTSIMSYTFYLLGFNTAKIHYNVDKLQMQVQDKSWFGGANPN